MSKKINPKHVQHTRKEKAHLRAVKRRQGPSAVRRRQFRHEIIEELECGCKKSRVRVIPCEYHTPEAIKARAAEADLVAESATVLLPILPSGSIEEVRPAFTALAPAEDTETAEGEDSMFDGGRSGGAGGGDSFGDSSGDSFGGNDSGEE